MEFIVILSSVAVTYLAIVVVLYVQKFAHKKPTAAPSVPSAQLDNIDVETAPVSLLTSLYHVLAEVNDEEIMEVARRRIANHYEAEHFAKLTTIPQEELPQYYVDEQDANRFLTDRACSVVRQRMNGTFCLETFEQKWQAEQELAAKRGEGFVEQFYEGDILRMRKVLDALGWMDEAVDTEDIRQYLDAIEQEPQADVLRWLDALPSDHAQLMIAKLVKHDHYCYLPFTSEWVFRELPLYGIRSLADADCYTYMLIAEDDVLMNLLAMDVSRDAMRYESDRQDFLRMISGNRRYGDSRILGKRVRAYLKLKGVRLVK